MLKTLLTSNFSNKKCAEIYCGNRMQFSVNCGFCELKDLKYITFINHFLLVHYEDLSKDFSKIHDSYALPPTQIVETNNCVGKQDIAYDDAKAETTTKQNLKLIENFEKLNNLNLQNTNNSNKQNLEAIKQRNNNQPEKPAYDTIKCNKMHIHKSSKTIYGMQIQNSSYKSHRKVLKISPYICNKCHKMYFSVKKIYEHQRRDHKRLTKNVDNNKNQNFNDLPLNDVKYVCEYCGKIYFKYSTLWAHRQTHKKKRFLCKKCNKSMTTAFNLREHMNSHNELQKRPYKCTICKRRFSHMKYLLEHWRIHTGLKPYACDICGRKFAQAAGLYSHRKIHEKY